MVDASGRVRHSRRLGEELRPASEFLGGAFAAPLRPGARVLVAGGAHAGVSAVVVGGEQAGEGAPSSSSALIRIRLFPSDEEVVVRREHLEEASRGGGGERGGGGGVGGGGDDERRRGDRDRNRRPSPLPPPATKRHRSNRSPPPPAAAAAAAESEKNSARWLLPGILVKIVDKRLSGGAFYLKRARVVDVPAPGIATLSIVSSSSSSASASSASLSGVRASSLETAVPRAPGAAVVVVEGPHRGRRGRLLARSDIAGSSSSSSSRRAPPSGTVQLRGDLEVVELPLDWFAEAAAAAGGEGDGGGGGGGGGDDDDDDE